MAQYVTTNNLSALFDPDNIRGGQAIEAIKTWGGIPNLEHLLKTNFKKGISKDVKDHQRRVQQYGDNQPIVRPPKNILELILQNFEDEMLRILCTAAIVSLVLGIATEGIKDGWLEGASILIAVVIIVTVTSANVYIKEKQFQKLQALTTSAKNVNCYRGGDLCNISIYELLVGDIVQIQIGQILSVDGILIQGNNVSVDQSSITGQSNQIKKQVPQTYAVNEKKSPFLISGSKIMEGSGLMLVAAVGKNSYFGKLRMKIQVVDDQTPLQEKLTILAQKIGNVGMVSAAATFGAMLLHYIYDCAISEDFFAMLFSVQTAHELIEYFIIAVIIIIIAVPQGLPLAVTIALAYSVGKMKDENNLVRNLQACETMGGANNICTDKTGTLTKNLMMVTNIFVQQQATDIIDRQIMKQNTCKLLSLAACNSTNATLKDGNISINQIGNKTECALLQMAFRMGYDYKKVRNNDFIKKIFPFNSQKKKKCTVYRQQKGITYCFVIGAPELLLPYCTKFINKTGNATKITSQFNNNMNANVLNFGFKSLRTVLIAYKQINQVPQEWDQVQNQLVIIGMVGIKDPLRDGIQEAVNKCHEAGVKVRMITGDNKNTSVTIAKQAGILDKDWQPIQGDCTVMQGKQFREFVGGLINQGQQNQGVGNMKNFQKVANQLCVLARSSPYDKYIIATGLKQLDNVVAMTGDGTGDAPALKKADIGFAMGIAGTQVAKQASGIILLDDNFSSIVTAIKWGRNIFDCIRKFLQFQLTIIFVALVMIFVGGSIFRESPLNPIQLLWINLIMDTFASLALATEPASDQLLKRQPYSRHESLITANMWKNIIAQGCFQIFILGFILFKGPEVFDIPSSIGIRDWNQETGKHYSIFFNVFVLMQIFNEINAKKLQPSEVNVFKNFFNNPLFIYILTGTIIIQLIMVEYGGKLLKTVELSVNEHILCLLLGSTNLLTGVVIKLLFPENLIVCLSGVEVGNWKYYWKKSEEQDLLSFSSHQQ